VLDTAETRLFPAVTTTPADAATEVSVPPPGLSFAALTLELKPDKAVDRVLIWVAYWP
jgi:hypothetical protein